MTENNLPYVWDKALDPVKEGVLWCNPNEPEKLRSIINGKCVELDPFENLEERKVKKTEEK